MKITIVVLLAGLLLEPTPALAQEPQSRAEALAREREAKQRTLSPHQPTGLESAMNIAETRVVPILQRDGIYAKFGSLTTGSGFAFGAGYRDRALVEGQGHLDVWAAGSLKGYWALEAGGGYPLLPGGALTARGHVRRYDYTREAFFGVGPDARRGDEAEYGISDTAVGGGLRGRLTRLVRVGGDVEYLRPRLRPAGDDDDLAIGDVLTPAQRLGLETRTNLLKATTYAEVDYRQPLNARRGGHYRTEISRYADRTGGPFSFTRVELDLRQYTSILAERRVFVARAWVSTSSTADGDQVPFFLMPALGGNTTLRGFRANRFRAPHALLLQGEYRWEIWSGLEAALFYDTGKVALRRADLNLRDLEKDYGVGFRFNTDNGVVMRVDAAFGSRDGRHLHIVFGGFF